MLELFRRFRKRSSTPVRDTAGRSYQAVRIQFDRRQACEAVRALEQDVFLGRQAPPLPLPDCSRIGTCKCAYRHQSDRRADMRRDTDHGLPERLYEQQERRSGLADRRRQRVA